uniref:non-specific serine/threonine protein kinase n=1 Tax=Lotharella globosa TaxID=91324 RepID=A0A6V3Q445_9EUKA|mmetsp:Transcript_7756/g.14920  ORF Transcript_7756/g.14920 Transcript_7756/m.14920 type:complete len:539 (+) Transcript_7756:110-1726(+)
MCTDCVNFGPKFEAVAGKLNGKLPVKFASLALPTEAKPEDEKWFDFAFSNLKKVIVFKLGKHFKDLHLPPLEDAIQGSIEDLFRPIDAKCTEDLDCLSQICGKGRCREGRAQSVPFSASFPVVASILLGFAVLLGIVFFRERLMKSSSPGERGGGAIQGSRVRGQTFARPAPREPAASPPPVISGGARQAQAAQQRSGMINGYKVVKKLGQGGFGAAYMVNDKHGEQCVLKTVKAQSIKAANEALVEVKQLSVLEHPNIVRYKDFFLHMEGVCIVMEFCEGGDLCDILQSSESISEDTLLKWTGEMCQAMSYIHDRDIIHRDLKPDNIFISRGSIRIADFGLSRVMPKLKGEDWWSILAPPKYAMSICGTDLYMAPEVLNEEPYGKAADVWSLGVVILELSMGSLLDDTPTGKTRAAYLEELISNKVRTDLICLNPLRSLIRNMLTKSAAERPSMARVLKNPLISAFRRKTRKSPLKYSATDIGYFGARQPRSRRPLKRGEALEASLTQKAVAQLQKKSSAGRKRKKSSGSRRPSKRR